MTGELAVAVSLSVVIVLFGAAFLVCGRKKWREFNERRPAISDEEFLRRCFPGVRPEVALNVRRIVSGAYGIDFARIFPESKLVELGGL